MKAVHALARGPAFLPVLALLVSISAGCATRGGPGDTGAGAGDVPATELDRLQVWMTGAFEARPEPGGRATSTHYMLAVPILSSRPDRWVYVVQWQEGSEDPDRQFVYHLQGGLERGLALDIYSLLCPMDNPTSPAPEDIEAIGQGCLERRKGCRVRLSQDGLSFVGGTRGPDCPTDYRGAQRLRIELSIRGDEVREWLQGYDAEGDRLWSADDGGRVYERVGER